MEHDVDQLGQLYTTPDSLGGLSIHEINLRHGTEGLVKVVKETLADRFADDDRKFITDAMSFAMELHKDQMRTNGPYIDHVLRVGLRIMHNFKIFDRDIIAGAFLHDAIEDQESGIEQYLGDGRNSYVALIAEYFNERTAHIVDKMSFEFEEGSSLSKNEQYFNYVSDIVENEPEVRVVKLSDFKDNAAGNHYTLGADKIQKLDAKYYPLYPVHIAGITKSDSLIPEYLRESMVENLLRAQVRAQMRLSV